MAQSSQTKTIGVVLCNLGGPDSLEAVQPFLYNLFSDPDIFRFPLSFLLRKPLAALISRLRARKSRTYFEAIGGKSPLKELTLEQAKALEWTLNTGPICSASAVLAPNLGTVQQIEQSLDIETSAYLKASFRFKVVVAMRYWHPSTDDAILELLQEQVEQVILLPLYPQYSFTTTRSSFRFWEQRCKALKASFKEIKRIEHYFDDPIYLASITERIQEALSNFPEEEKQTVHLLFSAHSIPLREVKSGDPYQKQIEQSVAGILQQLKILGYSHPHHLSYQSRVGPLKWLEPSTVDTLQRLASEGVKSVLTVPISFVSDHSETLYELKLVYGKLAQDLGIQHYRMMPALNSSQLFIEALRQQVLAAANLSHQE